MGLLKYTTVISVSRSVSEIQETLRVCGARSVTVEHDGLKQPCGISFWVETAHGPISFHMTVDTARIKQLLTDQWRKGEVPRSAISEGQPARVGWRQVKDWLDVQLAMIEIGLVTLDQIFLPYAVNSEGKTVYQLFSEDGRLGKLLGAGGA